MTNELIKKFPGKLAVFSILLLGITQSLHAQEDCYRVAVTDSLVLSPNGLPTNLCMGDPVNIGMATIVGYFHEIKKGEGTVKSGEGNGGALSFETTALVPEVGGSYQAVSNRYGCPTLLTNHVVLEYVGLRKMKMNGAGIMCAGSPKIVGIDSSENGVSYQLYKIAFTAGEPDTAIGNAVQGSGAALNFPAITSAGSYFVRESNSKCSLETDTIIVSSELLYIQTTLITSSSLVFKWNKIVGATGYQYAVTSTPVPPVSPTFTTDTTGSATGLSAATVYYVHARAQCAGGAYSQWLTYSWRTASNPPNCTAAPAASLCTNFSYSISSGQGAWDFIATTGVATPGNESVFSFTPAVTGYYNLEVVTSSTLLYVDFLYKVSTGGCTATGWTNIRRIFGNDKGDIGLLTAGVKYYIVADPESTSAINQTIKICKFDPPCAAPLGLTLCTAVTANIATGAGIWDFAGTFPNNSAGYSTPGKELAYTFTPATTGLYYLEITAASGSGYVDYLYKAASSGCSNNGWTGIDDIANPGIVNIGTLQAGVQYYFLLDRESSSGTSSHTFRICLNAPPVCASGTVLTNCTTTNVVIPSGQGSWNFAGTFPTNSVGQATPGKELVYRFTPATSGNYYLEITTSGTGYVDYLYKAASSGCSNTNWTGIGRFNSTGVKEIGMLQSGTEYYFLLDNESTTSANQSFRICLVAAPTCSTSVIPNCAAFSYTIQAGVGGWNFTGTWPNNSAGFSTPGKEGIFSFTPAEAGYYNLEVTTFGSQHVSYLYKPVSAGCGNSGWTGIGSTNNFESIKNIGFLQAGTPYYILADNETEFAAGQTIKICKVSASVCSTATVLSLCSPASANLLIGNGAWNYSNIPFGGTLIGREVIFKFTAPTTATYYFDVTAATAYKAVRYMMKTLPATCDNNNWIDIHSCLYPEQFDIGVLQAGTDYYFLLDTNDPYYDISHTFKICRREPPVCTSLQVLTPGVLTDVTIPPGYGGWDLQGAAPANRSTIGKEKLFSFTPPVSGNYSLELWNSIFGYANFYFKPVSQGCNSSGWVNIGEYQSNSIKNFGPLQQGVEYYILADRADLLDNNMDLSFRILTIDAPIVCNTAPVINVCTPVTAQIPDGYGNWNFNGKFPENSVGSATPGKEIMYRFTPSVTDHYFIELISLTQFSSIHYLVKPVTAGCGNTGWKGVAAFNSNNVRQQMSIGNLQAGVEYYLLLDNPTTFAAGQEFRICRSEPPVCSSANTLSLCTSVVAKIDSGFGAWDMSVTSLGTSAGFPTRGKELIYSFTPAATAFYYLQVDSISSTKYIDYLIKPADASCTASGWQAVGELNTKGARNFGQLQGGVKYYILLDNESLLTVTHKFKICRSDPPDCNVATTINTCSVINAIVPAGVGAWDFNGTYPNNSAGHSTIGKEVVYKFTPSVSGMYYIENSVVSGSAFVDYLYKQAGTCNNTGWKGIARLNNGGKNFGPLQVGTQYQILLDNEDTVATQHNFKICVAEIPNCSSFKSLTVASALKDTIPTGIGGWEFEGSFPVNSAGKSTPGKERFFRFTPASTGIYFLKVNNSEAVSVLYKTATSPCSSTGWTGIGTFNGSPVEKPIGKLFAGVEYIIVADNETMTQSFLELTILEANKLCPGQTISFSIPAITQGSVEYYWKVDKGSGYVEIFDNNNYSGTNTTSLTIFNAPSSFYGYSYRGYGKAIGGFGSFTDSTDFRPLQFVNTWTGASDDWNTSSNWSCGVVPDGDVDVMIPAGTPFTPVLRGNTSVRSLTVKPQATVRVAPGIKLDIRGK